jgi:acetylglutamate/LysW-gamma-L-alpha-aminoadipate kinase
VLVIKLGGSQGIDTDAFLDDLVTIDEPLILIHGANSLLDDLSRRLGVEPVMVQSSDGQVSRFTDSQTMDLFLMAYAGLTNKRIVEGLAQRGRRAVGLTGMDGGIVQGRRKDAIRIVENGKHRILRGDHAGSITRVDCELLQTLLTAGFIPVLTPPAVSEQGEAINVDGDKMAMEIAIALRAHSLLIFSNTAGLLRRHSDPESLIREANMDEFDELIEAAQGRMKKKVLACRSALESGVGEVILGDARVTHPIHAALSGAGTHLRARQNASSEGIEV